MEGCVDISIEFRLVRCAESPQTRAAWRRCRRAGNVLYGQVRF